jgi:hypothetical protein
MRHLFVAAAMLFVAIGITFGTATVLEVVAVAANQRVPQTVVVEAAKPGLKGGKERSLSMREGAVRSASADVASLR